MQQPHLYLYDDDVARGWQPFALTRPVGELLFGAHTLRARAEQVLGLTCAGHVTAPHLTGFADHDGVRVVDVDTVGSGSPRLFLSSRFVPAWPRVELPAGETVLCAGDEIVGRVVPAGAPTPDARWFSSPRAVEGAAEVQVSGRVLRHVWDLVAANPDQIRADFDAARTSGGDDPGPGHERVEKLNFSPGMLRVGEGVTLEPNVVFDFSHGPIWLGDGVTVRAFTRLAGPCFVGRGSTLLGGPFDAVTVGPVCKVHGELEESIVLGYSNKAHDGFLGHAYLGRWVNLGAMTTNSDLKNNYGTIRMWTPAGDTDTGLIKLGCLLGDHVKTGIGGLLNTGTVVGAGSNLYGTGMPPKHVPPFSWGSGDQLVAYDVDRFIAVARTVMERRDLSLDDATERMLRAAWSLGREGADA